MRCIGGLRTVLRSISNPCSFCRTAQRATLPVQEPPDRICTVEPVVNCIGCVFAQGQSTEILPGAKPCCFGGSVPNGRLGISQSSKTLPTGNGIHSQAGTKLSAEAEAMEVDPIDSSPATDCRNRASTGKEQMHRFCRGGHPRPRTPAPPVIGKRQGPQLLTVGSQCRGTACRTVCPDQRLAG